ncbi:MAG: cytochrome B [Gammaproteobacteria bacterium]|nr:cytochrome B [Gammaproteobacteria bacterium]
MSKEIRVWDPLIRIFHWSLVLAFSIGYLSGDEESNLHIYSGYAVLGLITFRVLWGVVGTRYARFSNFVHAPNIVIQHLKALFKKEQKHYVGHNPAGGWMVVAMLITLFVVTISGLKLYAIEEGLGPLAGNSQVPLIMSSAYADDDKHDKNENGKDEGAEEFWEEIHEVSSDFMVLLILLHITGVIVSGRLQNEHLIKAMFTGKKIR